MGRFPNAGRMGTCAGTGELVVHRALATVAAAEGVGINLFASSVLAMAVGDRARLALYGAIKHEYNPR